MIINCEKDGCDDYSFVRCLNIVTKNEKKKKNNKMLEYLIDSSISALADWLIYMCLSCGT